jgi:hypothetical protein
MKPVDKLAWFAVILAFALGLAMIFWNDLMGRQPAEPLDFYLQYPKQ